jgi:hypothetical protein
VILLQNEGQGLEPGGGGGQVDEDWKVSALFPNLMAGSGMALDDLEMDGSNWFRPVSDSEE